MAKKISQFDELSNPSGDEFLVTENPAGNNRVKLSTVARQGYEQVDNTSDADKPISDDVAVALLGKSNVGHTHTASEVSDFTQAVLAITGQTNPHGDVEVSVLEW